MSKAFHFFVVLTAVAISHLFSTVASYAQEATGKAQIVRVDKIGDTKLQVTYNIQLLGVETKFPEEYLFNVVVKKADGSTISKDAILGKTDALSPVGSKRIVVDKVIAKLTGDNAEDLGIETQLVFSPFSINLPSNGRFSAGQNANISWTGGPSGTLKQSGTLSIYLLGGGQKIPLRENIAATSPGNASVKIPENSTGEYQFDIEYIPTGNSDDIVDYPKGYSDLFEVTKGVIGTIPVQKPVSEKRKWKKMIAPASAAVVTGAIIYFLLPKQLPSPEMPPARP